VKNLRDGELVSYDAGKTLKPEMTRRGALEMSMGRMADPGIFQIVNRSGLSFDEFILPENRTDWATRGRVQTWLSNIMRQLDTIASSLLDSKGNASTTVPLMRGKEVLAPAAAIAAATAP